MQQLRAEDYKVLNLDANEYKIYKKQIDCLLACFFTHENIMDKKNEQADNDKEIEAIKNISRIKE